MAGRGIDAGHGVTASGPRAGAKLAVGPSGTDRVGAGTPGGVDGWIFGRWSSSTETAAAEVGDDRPRVHDPRVSGVGPRLLRPHVGAVRLLVSGAAIDR